MMKKRLTTGHFIIFFILICLSIALIKVFKRFLERRCQEKYSKIYNDTRQSLGIPVIPDNWHVKERDDEAVWWTGDESVIGHKRKSVMFSGCNIYGELDVYNLPLKDGKQRLIEIEYKYSDKHYSDSISYTYQIDHTVTVVSKVVIDSILTAEKIKKDY
jgi:hypothetical protein